MNDRRPVYDPNSEIHWLKSWRGIHLVGKIAIGICLVFGLVFVGYVILIWIALSSYGNNK